MIVKIFKYHGSSKDGNISARIKFEITFMFRLHGRPIQLVKLIPVGLSLTLLNHQQVLFVNVSSVTQPRRLTVRVQMTELNGTTVKSENKGNINFDDSEYSYKTYESTGINKDFIYCILWALQTLKSVNIKYKYIQRNIS